MNKRKSRLLSLIAAFPIVIALIPAMTASICNGTAANEDLTRDFEITVSNEAAAGGNEQVYKAEEGDYPETAA